MTPHDIVFAAAAGRDHGPAALAVLYVVGAAGGQWQGAEKDLAVLVGVGVRHLQITRAALVALGVLAYSPVRRGERLYKLTLPPPVTGADTPTEGAPPVVSVPAKRERKPQPTDPLFDAIVRFAYGGIRPKGGGRIAKLAVEMLAAGLSAERLAADLPLIVSRYAPHRETLDINTITACWRWLLSPPATVEKRGKQGPSANELAQRALLNGNPWAKPTQPEVNG